MDCTGHSKRTGEPCGRPASTGLDKCAVHCGLSKAERKRRAQEFLAVQAARKAVVTYGLPVDISPSEALLEEVRYTAGHVAWLRERVRELEAGTLIWGVTGQVDKGATEHQGTDVTRSAGAHMWLELYYRERKHLVDVTRAAISAGIEERRVRLAEQEGALLASVIRAVLDDPDLGLSAEQRLKAGVVVPRHLRAVTA